MKKNKMISNMYAVAAALLLLTAVSACSDELEDGVSGNSRGLHFTTQTEPWRGGVFATTRGAADGVPVDLIQFSGDSPYSLMLEGMAGAPVETAKTPQPGAATRGEMKTSMGSGDQFKISAFRYGGDYNGQTYFDGKTAVYDKTDGGKTWWKFNTTEDWRSWPSVEYVTRFYAWWPTTLSMDASTKNIDYTVAAEVKDQQDLLYAVTNPLNMGIDGQVDLTFRHAMTAVQFRGGTDYDMSIKKIELKNIQNQGTFNAETGFWTLQNGYTDYELNIYRRYLGGKWQKSNDGASWSDMSGVNPVLNDEDASGNDLTLLLMPQDLGVNTDGSYKQIVITLSDNTTLTADLTGTAAWTPGSTVVYTLQFGGTKASLTTSGGGITDRATAYGVNLSVISWRYVSEGGKPVKKIQPFIVTSKSGTEGNYVGFCASGTSSGNDWNTATNVTANPETFTYTGRVWSPALLASTDLGQRGAAETALQGAAVKGTDADPYDLSMYDYKGTALLGRCTANCYIVSSAGTYSFPAVYGNALVDGSNNLSSVTNNHKNANGVKITQPYVYDDCGATSATVAIVSDANHVIDGTPTLSADNHTIKFKTKTGTDLVQGNVILALKDQSAKTLWQWHIWVTAPTRWQPTTTDVTGITSLNGTSYDFFPVELGLQFAGQREIYTGKNYIIRLAQAEELGAFGGTPLAGGATYTLTLGHTCDPQDTRKVDYAGYIWGGAVPSALPRNNNTISFLQAYTTTGGDVWSYGGTVAAYDASAASDMTVVKTLYDPSPYGYHMPPPQAFNNLSTGGIITATTVNGVARSTYWKISKNASGGALGKNISLWTVGYWTALKQDGSNGCALIFNTTDNQISIGSSAAATTVRYIRPVKD